MQYSYFSVISPISSLLKQYILFKIFLQLSFPPVHSDLSMPYACPRAFVGYWCHFKCFWKVVSPMIGPPSLCKNPQNSSLFSRFSCSFPPPLPPLPKSVRFARKWWHHRTSPFWLFLEFALCARKIRKNKVLLCVVLIKTSIWSIIRAEYML